MPSIVGNIKIISIGSAGVAQFGDTLAMSPRSSSKTFAGSGSFNTGDFPITNNGISSTVTSDNDLVDDSVMHAGVL